MRAVSFIKLRFLTHGKTFAWISESFAVLRLVDKHQCKSILYKLFPVTILLEALFLKYLKTFYRHIRLNENFVIRQLFEILKIVEEKYVLQ